MAYVRVYSVLPMTVDQGGGITVSMDADLAFPFPEWVWVQTRETALCYLDDGSWNPAYLDGSENLPPLVCPTKAVVEYIGKRYVLLDTFLDDRVLAGWTAAWPSMTQAWITPDLETMRTNLIARRQDLMQSLPGPMHQRIVQSGTPRQEIRTIIGELTDPGDDSDFTPVRDWIANIDDDGTGMSEPWADLPRAGRARLRAWGARYESQALNHPTKLLLRLNELRLITMVLPVLNARLA